MPKTSAALATLAAAAVVAGGAAARPSAPVLTYCTDATFPPMEYATPGGAIAGFDVDLAGKLAATWGARAKPLKTAFPGLLPALNARKCDAVISGIFVTPDRRKQAGVVPYMSSHRVLIVRAGNPKHIRRPNDLRGKVVAVQAGTKYEEYLKSVRSRLGFALQSYPGDTDAVAQVLLGRADAVLTQDTSYAYQAKQHPGTIAIGFTFRAKDSFGIYYRKADPSLGRRIAAGIARLRKNGTLARIARRYQVPVSDVR